MDITAKKEGVWLRYRSIFSNEVKSVFMSGVQANRVVRRFNTTKYKRRIGYLQVQGVYKVAQEKSITILRGNTDSDTRKPARYIPTGAGHKQAPRDSLYHMAFHAAKLDSDVWVSCPITGIFGRLEMPALPIALVHTHPLSVAANAVLLVRAIKDESTIKRMERQVYAGTLLSLLRGKHLLRDSKDGHGETTAAECNMVLQAAGNSVLHGLCSVIARLWDNPNVWNKVPALNVDWRTHASVTYSGVNIAQVLQAYTRIITNSLEPLAMSTEDQAKYLTARRERAERGNVPSYIKIHSAAAVQSRNVRDSKATARKLFDGIRSVLPIVVQSLVSRTLRDLLLLPQSAKDSVAAQLELASNSLHALQAAVALELASLIREAKTERILDEVGSFMQEVSPTRSKSIAEILEAHRVKAEEKGSDNDTI